MDYPYINQPATDPNYRNKLGQTINDENLLTDGSTSELLLDNENKPEELSSGIDLSKMINFNNANHATKTISPESIPTPFTSPNGINNIDQNFTVNQMSNQTFEPTVVQSNDEPKNDNLKIDSINVSDNEEKEKSFLEQTDDSRIYQIEINKIVPNPYQPRREFSDDAIQELASSIREYGVLEPLIVKRIEKDQPDGINVEYQLIAGERRLRASKVAGLKTVPALIKTFNDKSLELEVALVENVQREDLSPIMKARAYGQLVNEFGYTQEMVGRRVGKSREAIANALRLLQLPFEAQKALDENKINESHARALLLLPNMEKQRALLGEVLSKQLSSREAEMIARQFLEKQNIKTGSPGRKRLGDSFSPKDLELREKLESLFDAKVMIKRKGEKGEISIYFYSEDEFNGLVDRIVHNSERNINQTIDKLNNL
ncbi:MAG TPA: ParB/RepB/Spo0J family partition protein [Candidatus Paceibacterota bacterium]|nr:ParB/RepB/Spo0J family partition protein [Candidatus Paceibacterota bacterium]